jgi:tryptophan-rich sensory protein
VDVARNISGLVAWVLLSLGAGLVGSQFLPGEWYAGLVKPSWNPPSWVFAPVWTTLYVLMGVAAWMVWHRRRKHAVARPLTLFVIQLAFNALWSYLFFGLHLMTVAAVEMVILLILIVMCTVQFWRVRPAAGMLLVPYILWVSFATVLTVTLVRLNG